jgi:hypothetical protein
MNRKLFISMMAVGLVAAAWTMHAIADGGATNAAVAAPAGEPKLVIDKMVYDFGTTSLVQQLSGKFLIKNGGTGILELKKPKTSCGCTVAALKTDKLAAGEETDLSFTMNVATVSRGHAEKSITVYSNDPKTPTVVLPVRAEIVMVYDYSPANIGLADMHLGATTNFVIHVKRNDGKPLGITRVEVNGGFTNIHAKLVASESSPSEATAEVEITGDAARRISACNIGFYGVNANPALFTVPVNGRIVGDIMLDRETLFWAIVNPNDWPGAQSAMVTQMVKVVASLPDQKLTLSNPTCTVPEVKVSITPVDDGKSYEIVAAVPKAPKEISRGTIKVETNYKSQPTIDIPVTVNVLKRD